MTPDPNDALNELDFDEKHAHFYDLIHDFLFILDSKGKILKINKAVTERLGYSIEDLFNKPFVILHPQEIQDEGSKSLSKLLKGETDSYNLPIRGKEGNLIPVETKITKGKVHDKDILIGISRDITERIKSEEALLREKKFTETALNTQMDTFFVFDPSTGKPIRWNKAFNEISGYSDEEIRNLKAPQSYYSEDDLLKLSKAIKLIEKGENAVAEAHLKTKDGYFIPFEYIASGIFDEKKSLKYIVAIGRNISDRKIAEKKILESEEKYRNLFEKSPNAIVLIDFTGKIIECNSATEKIFGYSIEELIGKNYLELPFYSERIINTLKERFQAITKKGVIEPQELEIKKKDGSIAIIKNEIAFVKIGEQDFFQAIIQDITEQKNAEQKLKESEENFRTIAEDSHLAITILQDDRVVYTNQKMADLFGYDREEMLTWSPKEYAKTVAEDSKEFVMEQARKKQMGDSNIILQYPIHCIKSSGEKFWVDNISTTIRYNGRPADLVTIIDITEKREAEQKLKESEEKFRTIAEQSSIGITILQDNEIKFINHKVSEELGYPHEEIKNWKLADLVKTVHPEDRDFIREQAIKKQVGEKDVVVEYEYRLFNKNGDIIWVKNLSKTITYNGRPADFISQVYITDMKRTEEKLKESEEKFRSLAEESSIGITILQDNEMKFFNGRLAEQAGYLRDEIKDWDLTTLLENLVHPDDRDFVREQAIKKQKGEKDVVNEYEYRFIHKNGDIRWTRTISKTILYNGRPADFISHIDITDIKETELQLRESEERYRHLFNISPFAVFIMNSNGIILDVNDTTEELFSIEKGDLVGKLSLNILNFPPETFKLLQKRQDSLINGKQVDPVEFQVTLKDGRKRWINSNLSAFTINHEIFFHAIIQDVTDRKDSELKLKESELKFRSIFEAIPDIYFLVTGDTTILDYKGNLNDFYLTPESFMGKKLTDIMPVKIARESLIAVKKTIETREPQVLEYDLELIKDLKSFEARLLYLSDDQVLIFVRDITERKRAEENLKRSEEKFRGIIEKNYDGYYEVNLRGDYIVASKEICDFMGYSEEELIGTNFSLYVIDKYIPWIKKQYNELYNYKKQQIILEYEIITKLGEEKYIEIAAYLKTDSNGERIGFYGISRDINLQKKLEESEEKYRNLFNTAPFGIALFNFKGIIIDINNALLQLIGLSLEDVIGKHYKEFHLYPEMEYLNFKARQNKIHNGELPKPRELLIYNKNGKKIWISSQLSFVQIGEMRFIQAIINDISERKTAEDELKASEANYRKAFDRANFYKDLFAHDMNNILQGVLSSVELYSLFNKNQDNTVDINEILEIIKESANRGAQLISNVQKLSRVDDLNIELQKINLCYFLNEAINFLRKKYHDKEILIHIETNTNDINVNANELLLDAFENLLINAVSYNNQKIIEILIKISFVKKVINEYVKIEFIDNGIGVEDSRKDKIFEVGNREYKGGKGMGIGLSLVKKTIESYGGEINVQDKIQGDHSKGSNFIVLIPKN